jgi:hypothetical protein
MRHRSLLRFLLGGVAVLPLLGAAGGGCPSSIFGESNGVRERLRAACGRWWTILQGCPQGLSCFAIQNAERAAQCNDFFNNDSQLAPYKESSGCVIVTSRATFELWCTEPRISYLLFGSSVRVE